MEAAQSLSDVRARLGTFVNVDTAASLFQLPVPK